MICSFLCSFQGGGLGKLGNGQIVPVSENVSAYQNRGRRGIAKGTSVAHSGIHRDDVSLPAPTPAPTLAPSRMPVVSKTGIPTPREVKFDVMTLHLFAS